MLLPTLPFPSPRARLAAVLLLAFAGCDGGSSDAGGGQSTTTETGDGKVHPEPNGVHVSEKAACEALTDKQESQLLALKCVGTGQTCPSFLRAEFQTACMEYDEGSVKGCVDYYGKQSTCAGLKDAIEACIVTPYPGTEPAGCPTNTGGAGGAGGTGGTGGTTGTGGTAGSGGTGGTGGTAGSGGTGGVMSGSGGMTTSGTGGI